MPQTHNLPQGAYIQDAYGKGSLSFAPVDTSASLGALLFRDGIDLDEINADLSGYKHVVALYPQGRLDSGSAPVQFAFGSSDYSNENPVMSPLQDFDGLSLYKLDYTSGGRFLSMQAYYNDYKTMSLSGLDIELVVTGNL